MRIPTGVARVGLHLLPWLIFAGALGITWGTWQHERQASQQALRVQFDFALHETVSRIEQRVLAYAQMLQGVQALWATTPVTNRSALRDYVDSLQLDANFSGVQSIGVVQWLPQQHLPEHLAAMRQAGLADYLVQPAGQRDAYALIVQREPDNGRARLPLGTDVWNQPELRLVMEQARDSGRVTISGKLHGQEDSGLGSFNGFVMCLPIFAKGQAHNTVAQRRAQVIGWVFASFQMNDFMASLYGFQSPGLTMAIYDGAQTTQAARLYHSSGGSSIGDPARPVALSGTEFMVVAGHDWTLSLSTQAAFEARYAKGTESVMAAAGVVLSAVLTLLAWLMVNGRERALRLAQGMTEELRHMAQHDTMTGLPNRALFNDRLNQELERAKRHGGRFAMAFLDLDYFKPINDNLGHDMGDLVLQQAARQLQASVRASDTVGRIGGDEFVVLLAQLSGTESVPLLAEKIHQALHQAFEVKGHTLSISSSIGVAIYPDHGVDALSLTKAADEAMYRAKEAGRDCVRLCEANFTSNGLVQINGKQAGMRPL